MRIGHIAKQAGVNIQTVRYYERRGLLPKPSRSASGYRQYDSDTTTAIRFIKNARDLGFTLREIGELIALRSDRSRKQLEVRQFAIQKIEEMDRKISQLTTMKGELLTLVNDCKSANPTKACVILAAIEQDKDVPVTQ